MHTDEYEISLSRELDVCEGYVRKYRKLLDGLEARHGMRTGELREWRQAHEAWLRWSADRDEYDRLLCAMQRSAR